MKLRFPMFVTVAGVLTLAMPTLFASGAVYTPVLFQHSAHTL